MQQGGRNSSVVDDCGFHTVDSSGSAAASVVAEKSHMGVAVLVASASFVTGIFQVGTSAAFCTLSASCLILHFVLSSPDTCM